MIELVEPVRIVRDLHGEADFGVNGEDHYVTIVGGGAAYTRMPTPNFFHG